MRWLTLLAAGPGALLGGWLGEHVGLRSALAFRRGVSLLLVLVAWRLPLIREPEACPSPKRESPDWLGAEADVRPSWTAAQP
jgi:predicted MFS family arabinose efflux permease